MNSSNEAALHLLSRLSDETPTSSPESFSDYYDEFEHKKRRSRRNRIKRFLTALTHKPFFLRTRRKFKGRIPRLLVFAFNLSLISFLITNLYAIGDGVFRPSYSNLPPHYKELEERVHASTLPGRGNPRNETVFIASNIIQHEMIRGPWGERLLTLIDYLGPENVFVSIYENDSGPETTLALSWLRNQLKCNHSIIFGDHVPISDFPTVIMPNGEAAVKRITYLSEIRNRMMMPLDPPVHNEPESLPVNRTITRFDKILFLNDVYYRPEDALHLLFSTHYNPVSKSAEFQATCALDFIRGGTLYDSFVIRDLDGHEISWFLYPWFTPRGSAQTRADVLSQTDAVRVRSCWSGLAAYDATPFLRHDVLKGTAVDPATLKSAQKKAKGSKKKGWHAKQELSVTPDPSDTTSSLAPHYPPLRFRHESELFWESSECCLINADLLARHPSIGIASTGIFVNPFVRVAYEPASFAWQPVIQRFERSFAIMQWVFSFMVIKPKHNPRRTEVVGLPAIRRVWSYDHEHLNDEGNHTSIPTPVPAEWLEGRWVDREVASVAPGGFCGQRRLFIMLSDLQKANRGDSGKNWQKVDPPWGW